jgi:hypothetical protein
MRAASCSLLLLLGCTFGASGGDASAGLDGATTTSDGTAGGADTSATAGPSPLSTSSGGAESSGAPSLETGDTNADTTRGNTGGDTSEPGEESNGDGSSGSVPACTSALLVTGQLDPTTSGDAPFYERLVALGFDVTVVGNAASQPSDADGHCLVLLSALGSATDVEDKFRDVAVPVVTWEYNLYDNMRMVDPGNTSAWGIADPQDDVEIVDAAHPLAGGAAGTVAIFGGGGRIAWGMPAGDAQIVATLPGDPERATIFGFEAGASMAGGFVAPARRVGYPHGETTATTTAQGVDLFEAAVLWAVQ